MRATLTTFRPLVILRIGVAAAAWLAGLAVLVVLCFTNKEGYCTTWGCRPAIRVLPLFHAAWFLALSPPMLFAASYGPPKSARGFAVVIFVFGIVLGGYDTFTWAQALAEQGRDVPLLECVQRWGYRLLTSVIDLPLLAILCSAGMAWIIANHRMAERPAGSHQGQASVG